MNYEIFNLKNEMKNRKIKKIKIKKKLKKMRFRIFHRNGPLVPLSLAATTQTATRAVMAATSTMML